MRSTGLRTARCRAGFRYVSTYNVDVAGLTEEQTEVCVLLDSSIAPTSLVPSSATSYQSLLSAKLLLEQQISTEQTLPRLSVSLFVSTFTVLHLLHSAGCLGKTWGHGLAWSYRFFQVWWT